MEFRPFEHAALLAKAWRHGAPAHNLGASAYVPDDPLEGLPDGIVPEDVSSFDLHVQTEFRAAVAKHLGVDDEMVRPCAGTTAANTAAIAHAVGHGTRVVSERPTYAPLWQAAEGFGGHVHFVDRDQTGGLDTEAVVDAITPDTSLVLLTSPNNPTGAVTDRDALLAIAEAAERRDAVVLVDQVYRELTDQPVAGSLHPNILSSGSLNKCWGAPGLRAGWLVGDPDALAKTEEIHRLLSLGASSPGTRLGTVMLANAARRRAGMEARLMTTHPIYESWAQQLGIDATHGALTAFPHVGGDTAALAERCMADGILVLPGEVFGRPGHLRIGLGVPASGLRAGLAALTPHLAHHS